MPEKSSVLNLPITPDNLCMVVYLQFEYLADLAPDQAEQFCQTDHPESSPGVKQLETGDSIFLKSKHLNIFSNIWRVIQGLFFNFGGLRS